MARTDLPRGVHIIYRQQYRRCGKAGCARCAGDGPGHGPYWYASWWAEGRRHSRYLGKEAPAAATGARAAPARPREQGWRAPHAALRVQTLGGFAVWRGETPLAAEQWASRRARALFQCLLSVPGHRLHREQAMEWLWPEADPAAAATNLRTTVHLLRGLLDDPADGASYLHTRGPLLTLVPGGAATPPADWLDAHAFAQAARAALASEDAAACRAALSRYTGEYLPDARYEPWAAPVRAARRQQYLALLRHLAHLSGAQGALEESEQCLRRLLAEEPTDEAAAAALMGLLAESGRRPEALRVYQALATALEEQLDLVPDAELAALRARLLAQEAAPNAAALPPPPTPERPTNLPVALSSFVGRTWELAELADLLATARLVTLTGPGGCGKTRLALEVAARQIAAYVEGVWLVELAGLAAPELLPQVVAAALGVAEQRGRPLTQTLADFLRPRQVLLVLDNCEHLLGACAALAQELLAACPHLHLLATSRAELGVGGERTYHVPSLATPDPAHLPPLEQLPTYEAVQLFLERAQARDRTVRVTAANAVAIATICARLDGLPLAIELAAARVSTLAVAGIAARLDDRFRLLTGGPRTALPRQQTLRATIDWSYQLLSDAQRVLLRRLAVFAGGWTLEAAEAVCGGAGVATATILYLLGGLVQQSLVMVERREDAVRYRLLETVRQYAQERLDESGEAPTVHRQHAAYYRALVEAAEREMRGPGQVAWLRRLAREHDNLRALLQWAHDHGEVELGLRTASALLPLWYLRGHAEEGCLWLERLLARADTSDGAELSVAVRSRARTVLGVLSFGSGHYARGIALCEQGLAQAGEAAESLTIVLALTVLATGAVLQGQYAQAEALFEESVARARARGDVFSLAFALSRLGGMALDLHGDHRRASMLCEESLALSRSLGDHQGTAAALANLGLAARLQGDYRRAQRLFEESLALHRELEDKPLSAIGLSRLGDIVREQGHYDHAAALYGQSLRLAQDVGDTWTAAWARCNLGSVALEQGDDGQAERSYRESLPVFHQIGETLGVAWCLEVAAGVAHRRGHLEKAARWLGGADALRAMRRAPLAPGERAAYELRRAEVRAALGKDAFAVAWTAGRDQPPEELMAELLTPSRTGRE